MTSVPRVAVVGGGVSGLAAARLLCTSAEPAVRVTLVEAAPRLGGKVNTRTLEGLPVDTGPDAVMARLPAMQALIDELDLSNAVATPEPLGAYVWSRGSLRRLPAGTSFGVPDRIGPLVRSRLLSARGLLRAGGDLVLPRRPLPADPTVSELLQPRLGREAIDRLVQPLLGGVHAGSTDELSAASTVPEIAALLRGGRSAYLTMRRRPKNAPDGPVMVSFEGGLCRLIDALAGSLVNADADVRTGVAVTALDRDPDGFRLTLDSGVQVEADTVVLAAPAYVTADLLANLSPAAAVALREIGYVDVATVTLAYPRQVVRRPLDATGFLVPPVEGRLLVGCSWLSSKWSALGDQDCVLIRAMVGRSGDRRWLDLDDDTLVGRVHDELVEAMGLAGRPGAALVQRWPRAIPQYTVGHADRVSRIDTALADVPGVYVTGAAYRGAGVASCVSDAQRTAASVLARSRAMPATSGPCQSR